MKKALFATSFALFTSLFSQETEEIKSPFQIQEELDTAQRDFETAQEMFLPWYTGPLITGSASNVPEGKWNIQPYLFSIVNHAEYNNHRKSINTPNTWILQPLVVLQRGLTSWLDATLTPQGVFRWSEGKEGHGFGDLTLTLGVPLLKETPNAPAVRLTVGETFPTGRFEKLNPDKEGLDASGSGAYATTLGLFLSKILWQIPLHPMRFRLAATYEIPNHRVHVRGSNAFGGGLDTRGDVSLGQTFNADLGIEISLTKHWVFATDVAYTYSMKTTFQGNPGLTPLGTPASVGGPSSDQLSLAPAIEYNVSDRGGFIGGVWFSVTGRNSANFASLVLSYTWLF